MIHEAGFGEQERAATYTDEQSTACMMLFDDRYDWCCVFDRFHVQRLAQDALDEVRMVGIRANFRF